MENLGCFVRNLGKGKACHEGETKGGYRGDSGVDDTVEDQVWELSPYPRVPIIDRHPLLRKSELIHLELCSGLEGVHHQPKQGIDGHDGEENHDCIGQGQSDS
ncbi:hypothetical protein SDC9_166531 [bioreactor metagenome]|uniref:Uncharacterized protein n=1 Tax=bioreactor metagenome TaxID=1076179 RepID=A0A645FXJ0_9ZZZZ